jgi:hypothetical protein
MVDGVGFAEHTCIVALGIGIDGPDHQGAGQARDRTGQGPSRRICQTMV